MSSLLIFIASTFLTTGLMAQEQGTKNTTKPAGKESVTIEVEMEETLITPLNVPEDEMFRLPEDATPSLVSKKKKLLNESSKLTKYSEKVSDFIDKQNEDTVSDSEKEKLNKLLESYTKQLNEVEKAEDDFLTELIEYNRTKDNKLPKGEVITDKEVKSMRALEKTLPSKEDQPEALMSH